MTATAERLLITEPGVYDGIPDEVYHADPVPGGSLSSTGARKLLPPSCPAKFRYEQNHPQPRKPEFDLGKAAHKLVLGTGPELVAIKADNYRTKAAQQQRDDAYADGAVPLLPHEYEQVEDMAAALRAHPIASALLNPAHGKPEQSLFWPDHRTGIMRRARLDWLPNQPSANGRLIVPDYKTAASSEPTKFAKAISEHGYHQQADWYVDGVLTLGLAERVAFVFIAQEKTPPYVVTVVQPDDAALFWGDVLNSAAIDIYRRCTERDYWPGYSDEVVLAPLPRYTELEYERAREAGAYEIKDTL